MDIKSIIGVVCVCLAIASFNVSAVVVTDTNYTYSGNGLSAYRSESDCCTSMSFDKENKSGVYNYLGAFNFGNYSTLTPIASTADVSFGYFLVSKDVEFTDTTIATGQFTPFLTQIIAPFGSSSATSIDVPFGTFYLGIAIDNSFDNEYTEFGWIQLSNSFSGLEMITSAIAYDEGGIIIGTTEAISAVPVPSAVWLFGSGLIALTRRKA